MKYEHNTVARSVVVVTLLLAGMLWFTDSIFDYLWYNPNSNGFFSILISLKDPHELMMRLIYTCAVIVGGISVSYLLSRLVDMESSAREQEENLHITLNSIGDAVIVTDIDGNVIRMNPVAERLTGWKAEDAVGEQLTDVFAIVNSNTGEAAINPVIRVLEKGEVEGLASHTLLISKNGNPYQIADSAAPIRDVSGKITGVVMVFRDITTEYQMRKDQSRLAVITEQAAEGIAEADLDGKIRFYNRSWATMHGYDDTEELVGMHLSVFHTKEQIKSEVNHLLQEALKNGHVVGEVGHKLKNGSTFPTMMTVTLLKDQDGSPYGFAGFAVDITDRKRADDEHVRHLQFLEKTARIDSAILEATDMSQMMSDVIKTTRRIFGCDRTWLRFPCDPATESWHVHALSTSYQHPSKKMIGDEISVQQSDAILMKELLEVHAPVGFGSLNEQPLPSSVNLDEGIQAILLTVVHPRSGPPWLFGIEQCSNERVWTIEERDLFFRIAMRLGDALGSLLFMSELRESEARIRSIFRAAPTGIGVVSDRVFQDVNDRITEITGYSKSELIGQSARMLYPSDEEHEYVGKEKYRQISKHGTGTVETRWVCKDGRIKDILLSSTPMDPDNLVLGVTFTALDITDRKEALEAMVSSEAKFKGIYNQALHLAGIVDLEGNLLDLNDTASQFINVPKTELMGKPFWETPWWTHSQEAQDRLKQAIHTAAKGEPDRFETTHLDAKGNTHYIDFSIKPVRDDNGKIFCLLPEGRDITERKQQENELHHLQNYLENIIDSMPSMIIGVDSAGTITQWNSEAYRITGVSSEDALGKSLIHVIPRLSSEMIRVREAMESRQTLSDARQVRKENGQILYEDITVYPLVADGVDGAVIRVDDVTEEVRIHEMMVQSEKMLSVGGLAAGMAHEINNPLGGMMQTAHVVGERLTNLSMPANIKAAEEAGISMDAIKEYMESRKIITMLDRIRSSGSRAAEIVSNMLSFARKSDSSYSSHNIASLLDKCVDLAASDYDLKKKFDFKQISIIREYPDAPVSVPCESSKIQQVLLNILRNGSEAMQEKAEQDSPDWGKFEKPHFILRLAEPDEEGMVCIEIEDNGPGMDEDTRKRVFEPFFTTKPTDRGTGLGMSVSYFIITESHDGELSVESTPGLGTKFTVKLPISGRQSP